MTGGRQSQALCNFTPAARGTKTVSLPRPGAAKRRAPRPLGCNRRVNKHWSKAVPLCSRRPRQRLGDYVWTFCHQSPAVNDAAASTAELISMTTRRLQNTLVASIDLHIPTAWLSTAKISNTVVWWCDVRPSDLPALPYGRVIT